MLRYKEDVGLKTETVVPTVVFSDYSATAVKAVDYTKYIHENKGQEKKGKQKKGREELVRHGVNVYTTCWVLRIGTDVHTWEMSVW